MKQHSKNKSSAISDIQIHNLSTYIPSQDSHAHQFRIRTFEKSSIHIQ